MKTEKSKIFLLLFSVFLLSPLIVNADNCCSTTKTSGSQMGGSIVTTCITGANITTASCTSTDAGVIKNFTENTTCDTEGKYCINPNANTKKSSEKTELKPIKFTFNVPIPGISRTLEINNSTLSNYLSQVYKFKIGLTGLLAVFMITLGGLMWIFSGGNPGKVTKAKEYINGAIMGLLLALSSYSILYIINPQLVENKLPEINTVKKVELEIVDTVAAVKAGVASPSDFAPISKISGIIAAPTASEKCTPDYVQKLAKNLNDLTVCVGACHCAWTVSAFLNYAGCLEGGNANVDGLASVALQKKWIHISGFQKKKDRISKKNIVGILYTNGHVGLYLGNNNVFQSGGYHPKINAKFSNMTQNPSRGNEFKFCGKVPGHTVADNAYRAGFGGGDSCTSIQSWVLHTLTGNGYSNTYWSDLYVYPSFSKDIEGI